nr:hypothetical protein pmam_303 [Pithovirus mammoth]
MELPSLFNLSLTTLPVSQTREICESGEFPPCEGVWERKAELELNFWEKFFNLYLGSETSSKRPISEYFRYLELASVNSFLPELAASKNVETGEIFGLYESFAGLKEAVLKGDETQFDFFFTRLRPETLEWLKTHLKFLHSIEDLFPQGPGFISLDLFDKLLQETGQMALEEYPKLSEPSAAQRWVAKDMNHYPLRAQIRNQKAMSKDSPQVQLLENWDQFSSQVLLKLIERGNRQALDKVLDFFDNGRFDFEAEQIFLSILRSGELSFVQAFEPFIQYVVFYDEEQSQKYFDAAAFGGNWENVEMVSKLMDLDIKNYLSLKDYLISIIKGFFFHRDLSGACFMIDQLDGYESSDIFEDVNFASVPLDIIDLVYHRTTFYTSFSEVYFLSSVMWANLGYLNVVQFCLDELEKLRGVKYFKKDFEDTQPDFHLDKYEVLTPLSVSLVRSAIETWNFPKRVVLVEEIDF